MYECAATYIQCHTYYILSHKENIEEKNRVETPGDLTWWADARRGPSGGTTPVTKWMLDLVSTATVETVLPLEKNDVITCLSKNYFLKSP